MMRANPKGDLYVHQGERSDREQLASGKASRRLASGLRTCPDGVSTRRTTGGANWNVIALTDLGGVLDSAPPALRVHRGAIAGQTRCAVSRIERYIYTPYGEVTVHQENSYGDRDAPAGLLGGPEQERPSGSPERAFSFDCAYTP